ncbi:MAG TPA: DegQ family serine endoprotease [Azospirillaceae bacterium]|nr:DegQ family serine endoprotease [Azospirillaceae bacterium]
MMPFRPWTFGLAALLLSTTSPVGAGLAAETPTSFAPLAKAQLGTVVNISTTQKIGDAEGPESPAGPRGPQGGPQGTPPGLPPGLEEFFREFGGPGGPNGRQRPVTALGSGFIIDSSGLIVTNNHVVAQASEISVILHDESILKAELVGADPLTDLALLKVDAGKPLPATRWGDSDKLEVGDWLVAIGNPFGLGGTVTAGILSARARDIQSGPYDEYLQTDAAINRGNSGGPLFNANGEVVGINTAIFSPTGGSVGIGFAVPASLARPVIEEIKQFGQPKRGWLGVQIQQVTPEIAESLGLDKPRGALVTSVSPEGPAQSAGVRQGDVILSFNGQPIERMRSLPRLVADTDIGAEARISVLREGREETLPVRVGDLAQSEAVRVASADTPAEEKPVAETVLGLSLSPLTEPVRERLELEPEQKGVAVVGVDEDSAAAERGIAPGDLIQQVQQRPVSSPDEVERILGDAREKGRKSVLVLVNRQGNNVYVPLPTDDTAEAPPENGEDSGAVVPQRGGRGG